MRFNWFHLVSVLRELRIYLGSFGVLPVHFSSVLSKNFRLVILLIHSDKNIDYTHPGANCELVSLVAIIFRYLHNVMVKGSLTVPGTYVGQTHWCSLEGKSTITAWKLAPRHKSVKQVANVTDSLALSLPLPILISRCWIS